MEFLHAIWNVIWSIMYLVFVYLFPMFLAGVILYSILPIGMQAGLENWISKMRSKIKRK